ncbi:hypothetical protein O181_094913, partial [Austropuccinia psidii MF-1]|nr:hypothetical protein [Austropuccinia psidii MF-1]
HFDPGQTYDGYKEVEVLDPPCTECLAKGKYCFSTSTQNLQFHFCFVAKKPCHCPGSAASNVRRYFWSKKDGPFGKEFPVSEGPTPDATSGYSDLTGSRPRNVARWTNVGGSIQVGGRPIYSTSEVPISRIKTVGLVKRIRRIANSPPDLDAEALSAIPNFLPHYSPSSSHTRPAINPALRPSPIQQSRASPIGTSHQLQPEARSGRRREELSPLPFPASQVFQ